MAKWGGTCHKGNKLYVHVFEWPKEGLAFDPLPNKVLSAPHPDRRAGHFVQSDAELSVQVADADRAAPVTVIELTLDTPIETGKMVGNVHAPLKK